MSDLAFMQLALQLAEFGVGDVNPNPLVGAVIVSDGEIVGRGYHRRYGGPHAEVFALEEAGRRASGATLYVTLEPCCHHAKKTPPCTDRIVAAGLSRVVVAVEDPNPAVAGRGVAALRSADIRVDVGLLKAEAKLANEVFFRYITTGMPFVHLKLATSLDGRIATHTGDSKWITGTAAREEAHRLRRRYMSVLVGVGTVLADDPRLDVRHVIGKNPTPIVLDALGECPPDAALFTADRAPIVAVSRIAPEARQALEKRGARVWQVPGESSDRVDLHALLRRIGGAGIDSVLVEGGGETAASFLEAGLVHKVSWMLAPLIFGGRNAVPAVGGEGVDRVAHAIRLTRVSVVARDEDLEVTGYPRRFDTAEGDR